MIGYFCASNLDRLCKNSLKLDFWNLGACNVRLKFS